MEQVEPLRRKSDFHLTMEILRERPQATSI
jgi:hypothetical protein